MPASSIALPTPIDLKVAAEAPLEIDYPELPETGAVCIGLSFEWRHRHALHEFALHHTLPDEHARAERLPKPEDSLRNLLGRSLLRHVAVHYGGLDPMQPIRSNTWGKPELNGCSVGCNVSHSESQVWVALSRFPRVGVDVESVTVSKDLHDICAGFHPDEIAALRRVPDSKLTAMRYWSRKEAVMKATGMGLALSLRAYAVDCDPKPSGWLRLPPPRTMRGDWTTLDLPVNKDYVGALAIEGHVDSVTVLRLKVEA